MDELFSCSLKWAKNYWPLSTQQWDDVAKGSRDASSALIEQRVCCVINCQRKSLNERCRRQLAVSNVSTINQGHCSLCFTFFSPLPYHLSFSTCCVINSTQAINLVYSEYTINSVLLVSNVSQLFFQVWILKICTLIKKLISIDEILVSSHVRVRLDGFLLKNFMGLIFWGFDIGSVSSKSAMHYHTFSGI